MATFKLVRKVPGKVNAYGHEIKTGDTFTLTDDGLIGRARANADFDEVKKVTKKKKKK